MKLLKVILVLTVVSSAKCEKVARKRASSEGNEKVSTTAGLGAYSTHGFLPSSGRTDDYSSEYQNYYDEPKDNNHGSISSVSHATVSVVNERVPVPVPQPYPVIFTRRIPIHVAEPIAVPVPRPVHVSVPVPQPIVVPRAVPYTIIRRVPVAIPTPVRVPVAQPVEVPVARPYPVAVPQHVPAKIPQTIVVYVKGHGEGGYSGGESGYAGIKPAEENYEKSGNERFQYIRISKGYTRPSNVPLKGHYITVDSPNSGHHQEHPEE